MADLQALKARAWDLAEEMGILQAKFNALQEELTKTNKEIKEHGSGPKANPTK